jgi:hypothetical protein
MTEPQPLQPLWDDERIKQVAEDIIHPDPYRGDRAYMAAVQNTVAYLLGLMRDEYEARIAELEEEEPEK